MLLPGDVSAAIKPPPFKSVGICKPSKAVVKVVKPIGVPGLFGSSL